MPPIIELDNLRKTYRIARTPTRSLKEQLFLVVGRKAQSDAFVALDGVTLHIEAGSTVGLIGPNGSGKSTLFKIISRILRPTSGRVTVHGRVSPLIELSAGFHPELTGAENVVLNGAIYGLTRRDMLRRADAIYGFADLGAFVDQPVRTYSSGMLARLGFSIAINIDAEILLIDEVLAVGDLAFQQKCQARIRELQQRGTTIIIVSHSPEEVAATCGRAVRLERGRVVDDGPSAEVTERYKKAALAVQPERRNADTA